MSLIACMIGDDQLHAVDPDDLEPISHGMYCGECGQIGCHCDGYDDSEDE